MQGLAYQTVVHLLNPGKLDAVVEFVDLVDFAWAPFQALALVFVVVDPHSKVVFLPMVYFERSFVVEASQNPLVVDMDLLEALDIVVEHHLVVVLE